MRKLLQIFHVSDAHVTSTSDQAATHARSKIDRWIGWLPPVADLLKEGTAGHDPYAFDFLKDSIKLCLDTEPEWRSRSMLVSTGDLSTWGDDASIQEAVSEFEKLADDLDIKWGTLYGNHDVWPGSPGLLPLDDTDANLAARRTRLRSSLFNDDAPIGPIVTVPLTFRTGNLGLYTLNTILHESVDNFLALGNVDKDRYWEPGAQTTHQLQALDNHCKGKPDVRIVLTHHPVHDPDRKGLLKTLKQRFSMYLKNAAQVADALAAPHPGVYPVLASVVLSGHTHEVFPETGDLPDDVRYLCQSPLHNRQVQLIVGTLAQTGWDGKLQENTWQRIRLTEDRADGIVLERRVYSRTSGMGRFLRKGNDERIKVA